MPASPDCQPTYPRFALDWPDGSGPLGKKLMAAFDLRHRALKSRP